MVSSDVRLVNFEALKWSDRPKLWSQKMLAIFEAMGLYNNILSNIRLSALPSEQEWITFQHAQLQGRVVIISVMSKEKFAKLANLKIPHKLWSYLWTSYRHDLIHSYVVVLGLFMHIE
jgi:hypothetical protein